MKAKARYGTWMHLGMQGDMMGWNGIGQYLRCKDLLDKLLYRMYQLAESIYLCLSVLRGTVGPSKREDIPIGCVLYTLFSPDRSCWWDGHLV
jgi:hypothetical protein